MEEEIDSVCRAATDLDLVALSLVSGSDSYFIDIGSDFIGTTDTSPSIDTGIGTDTDSGTGTDCYPHNRESVTPLILVYIGL